MSQSRRLRRANGMKAPNVRRALESNTPLNSLYAFIPQDRRKALDLFRAESGGATRGVRTGTPVNKKRPPLLRAGAYLCMGVRWWRSSHFFVLFKRLVPPCKAASLFSDDS